MCVLNVTHLKCAHAISCRLQGPDVAEFVGRHQANQASRRHRAGGSARDNRSIARINTNRHQTRLTTTHQLAMNTTVQKTTHLLNYYRKIWAQQPQQARTRLHQLSNRSTRDGDGGPAAHARSACNRGHQDTQDGQAPSSDTAARAHERTSDRSLSSGDVQPTCTI